MIEDDNIIKDGDDDDQSKYWYLWIFYFNPNDKRIFVPKRYGFGLTNNFANPISVAILLIIIFMIFYTSMHRK